MVDATHGFLCGQAMESPLVIVFDDLHWADEASLNLLLNVMDLIRRAPDFFHLYVRSDKPLRVGI